MLGKTFDRSTVVVIEIIRRSDRVTMWQVTIDRSVPGQIVARNYQSPPAEHQAARITTPIQLADLHFSTQAVNVCGLAPNRLTIPCEQLPGHRSQAGPIHLRGQVFPNV